MCYGSSGDIGGMIVNVGNSWRRWKEGGREGERGWGGRQGGKEGGTKGVREGERRGGVEEDRIVLEGIFVFSHVISPCVFLPSLLSYLLTRDSCCDSIDPY